MLQPVRHTLGGASWALTHGSCTPIVSQRFRAFQLKSALIARCGATETVLQAVAADQRWCCLVAAALEPAAHVHLVGEQANIVTSRICSNALPEGVREGRAHQCLLLPL